MGDEHEGETKTQVSRSCVTRGVGLRVRVRESSTKESGSRRRLSSLPPRTPRNWPTRNHTFSAHHFPPSLPMHACPTNGRSDYHCHAKCKRHPDAESPKRMVGATKISPGIAFSTLRWMGPGGSFTGPFSKSSSA